MGPRVNFFIVGTPKSGTTALASFLDEHPQITISNPKEPGFFATDLMAESDKYHKEALYYPLRTLDQYLGIFRHARPGDLLGEASTTYLYSKTAVREIRKYNPSAKIIVILRNPIDFLHALHMQFLNEAKEDEPDFQSALSKENQRLAGRDIPKNAIGPSYYNYREWANYPEQLARLRKLFPKSQVKVIISEEFQADNKPVYREVLEFLEVDSTYTPDFKKIHGSKTPRSKQLNRLLNNPRLKKYILRALGENLTLYNRVSKATASVVMQKGPRQPIDPMLRKDLYTEFLPRITKTAELIDRGDLDRIWSN